jgi:hypothetical protein
MPLFNRIKSQLQAVRNTQLVKNAEKIVADRVFADSHLQRNLAVRVAVRNPVYDLSLSLGQQRHPFSVGHAHWSRFREGVQKQLELAAIGPHLSVVHGLNTFAKLLKTFGTAEYALSAFPEGMHDELIIPVVENYDAPNLGMRYMQDPESFKAHQPSILKISIEQRDI